MLGLVLTHGRATSLQILSVSIAILAGPAFRIGWASVSAEVLTRILFADGQVWALSPDMPIDALKPFLTIPAAKTADRDKQLAPYRVN
jgi:hypothetical protein